MIFETWISKPRNSTVHWLWRDCTTWLWRGMTQKPSQSRLGLGKRFQLVFNQYFMSFHRYINTLYHRYEAIFSGALVLLHGDFWRGKATKRPSPSRLPVKVYYWVYLITLQHESRKNGMPRKWNTSSSSWWSSPEHAESWKRDHAKSSPCWIVALLISMRR